MFWPVHVHVQPFARNDGGGATTPSPLLLRRAAELVVQTGEYGPTQIVLSRYRREGS